MMVLIVTGAAEHRAPRRYRQREGVATDMIPNCSYPRVFVRGLLKGFIYLGRGRSAKLSAASQLFVL